ncbi:4-hydroxy-tetrahydrodipicolinate reductase [Limibacter armeniacum]|uniref:4-hydroxy-tetrahydrodipicolinate reductase n=1 Tax=Limibacter armeniacum TaxID=466084 RepID=UPI002FE6285D
MRVLLIGYGKMGKTIEEILTERGHKVVGIVDRSTEAKIKDFSKSEVDVAIEFTEPSAAYDNITACLEEGIPLVSGTTGWLDRRENVEKLCAEKDGAFFWASNFSLGVNIFFALNNRLAELMNPHADYKVSMEEIHHTEKKDAPSGTAITLAEGVIDNLDRIENWSLKGEGSQVENILEIAAVREPDVPGTHEVVYESEMDKIEIKHTAHTRKSFALGAVVAAEWLPGKKGILSMQDMLGF